jgi:ketosteroid isomerase-like protein
VVGEDACVEPNREFWRVVPGSGDAMMKGLQDKDIGFATGRIKATNRTFEDHFVFAITVRNGKLTNIREYVDTQALARASEMAASPRP